MSSARVGTLLLVDDQASQRAKVGDFLRSLGHEICEAADGDQAIARVREGSIDFVLLEQRREDLGAIRALRAIEPEIDIVVVTANGSVADAVAAMKEGAVDYLTQPIDLDELELVVRRTLEHRRVRHENRELRQKLAGGARFEGIVSCSGRMEELLSAVARSAPTEATVLITGESGTGKELIARAIHAASPRASGPFMAVHCGALAESILESELFGHERGAFTGASHARRGRFEAAAHGTLFLDEIGDVTPNVQVKLLRVLQERRIERVGSNVARELDVRLIAATHRDLLQLIHEGSFREDLYYRLAVVKLFIPPLRQRRQDVPHLVQHFLSRHTSLGTHPVTEVSREALDALVRYEYPGNVRELENIIQSAIVLSREELLTLDDLPPAVRSAVGGSDEIGDVGADTLPGRLMDLERQLIGEALDAETGNQSRAARRLGISERALRYKLEKLRMK